MDKGNLEAGGAELFLAVQSYFALVVKLTAQIWLDITRACPRHELAGMPNLQQWQALEQGQTAVGRLLGLDRENLFGWYLHLPTRSHQRFFKEVVSPIHTQLLDILQHWSNSWIGEAEEERTQLGRAVRKKLPKNVQSNISEIKFRTSSGLAGLLQRIPTGTGSTVANPTEMPDGWAEQVFRDHFQQLYQTLLPEAGRRRWGEYATADSLARHVVRLAGYQGLQSGRFLDPACGSGSFLMAALYISWKNKHLASASSRPPRCSDPTAACCSSSEKAWHPPDWILQATERIVGWDRNGLAVLAARANWLIALGPWMDLNLPSQIPIFLQDLLQPDSLLTEPLLTGCSEDRLDSPLTPGASNPPTEHFGLGKQIGLCDQTNRARTPYLSSALILSAQPGSSVVRPSKTPTFDFVVGNPPWLVWDHLEPAYRQFTEPLWRHYGLFSLSAKEGRLGGAKKDLAALITYVTADRYLKPAGRLAFLLPNSLLHTQGAGDGFRRFRLPDGTPLKVLEVEDFSAFRLFANSNQRTIVLVLQKGEPTVYPVRYWRRRLAQLPKPMDTPAATHPEQTLLYLEPVGATEAELCLAEPIQTDRPCSPWRVRPASIQTAADTPASTPKTKSCQDWLGPADYVAYLGANTGGANEIFWFELLGLEDGKVRLRPWKRNPQGRKSLSGSCSSGPTPDTREDLGSCDRKPKISSLAHWLPNCPSSKTSLQVSPPTSLPDEGTESLVLEPDLLFPLVRWQDVHRWHAQPSCWILLVQDPQRRRGLEPTWLQEYCPAVWRYLQRWEDRLRRRAAYQRYQPHAPFYSLYNVGLYTLSAFKVVWRRMDRQLRAAVLQPIETPWGPRPIVPQETCCLIPTQTAQEAYYLSALLNSRWVNQLVEAVSLPGSKGFASPGMLRWIPLRRFDPRNARHQQLAELARSAHRLVLQDQPATLIEQQIEMVIKDLLHQEAPAIDQ
ncbi:MAG: hypothetical protein NZ602_12540 [Thermoguttaceae bacterium]|nr:hypothetical protein [Thermoguttaceae bacterium]MDW8037310.1 hypothetical protein [Thermoguttaceae bacterium]